MIVSRMTLGQAVLRARHACVLVAEDDPAMRQLLALRLRRAGLKVIEAASGDEALDRMADHGIGAEASVDLIIADVCMPGCTGLDLLASLRHFGSRVPVILITGFGNAETHAQAKRLDAFAVLDKPFDLEDLETVVLNAPTHSG